MKPSAAEVSEPSPRFMREGDVNEVLPTVGAPSDISTKTGLRLIVPITLSSTVTELLSAVNCSIARITPFWI